MRVLQLTIFVRDLRTGARRELSFARSPVMVGRQARGGVGLDALTVSRRHGEFRFGKGGLRYVDLESTNGTYVDGAQIEPHLAVQVLESSVIDVVPFQMTAHLELVSRRRKMVSSAATTVVDGPPPVPPPAVQWSSELARSTSMQRLFLEHGTVALFHRATLALEVLATFLRKATSTAPRLASHLGSFANSAEFVAHLVDPAGGAQRLDELRDLLATVFQSTQNILPEGTS